MTRIQVDFSTTVRGGLVRASLRRLADGETLARGDLVEAFDDDEGFAFDGVVEEIDERFAYLRMNWVDRSDSAPLANAPGRSFWFDSGSNLVAAGSSSTGRSVEDPLPRVTPISPTPVRLRQPA